MSKVIALIMALTLAVAPTTEGKTVVTKIHEDDQITVETNYNGKAKERMIHGYDFNIPIRLHENIPTEMVVGRFTSKFTELDGETYYQFKSYDDTVWWALSENDLGFAPTLHKEYALVYCNNGTTKENKGCDCLPEWECECEVYDDVFIEIFEEEKK